MGRVNVGFKVLILPIVLTFLCHATVHAQAALYGFDVANTVPPRLFTVVFKRDGIAWHIDVRDSRSKLMSREAVKSAFEQDQAISTKLAFELAGRFNGRVITVYHAALKGFTVEMNESDAHDMAADPRITSISAALPTRIAATQTNAPWALARISQRNLPLGSTYTYFVDGSGINVLVLDTGVKGVTTGLDVLAAIKDNCVSPGQGNFTCTPAPTGIDCNGHGSEMTSLIAASVYGVAKNPNIISVVTQDCNGDGLTSYWTTALDWVLDTYFGSGVGVIGISASGNQRGVVDQGLVDAVTATLNAGFIFVAAASPNVADDSCQYQPANIPGVIAVAATDQTDAIWTSSATGGCISLYAPGVNIDATDQNGDHVIITGESGAAALTTGVAALWMEQAAAHGVVRPFLAELTRRRKLAVHATDLTLYYPGDPKTPPNFAV